MEKNASLQEGIVRNGYPKLSLKRARSRSGCFTCRKRKKRCDEARPVCGACRRLDIECQYPPPGKENRNSRRRLQDAAHIEFRSNEMGDAHPLHFPLSQLMTFKPAGILDDDASTGLGLGMTRLMGSTSLAEDVPPEGSPHLASADPLDPFDLLELNESDGDEIPISAAAEQKLKGQSPFPGSMVIPTDSIKADSNLSTDLEVTVSYAPSTEELKRNYPDLGDDGVQLFEYFRDKQSLLMSVSPLNYFRSVYLVFALRCRAVLYALLAWAGFHAGRDDLGKEFFDESSRLILDENSNDVTKEELLASILILAAAKIFSGDIKYWHDYMKWAASVIQSHGGIFSFMESDSVKWLLKNFAYKEILRSSSSRLPALFTSAEFEYIFAQPMSAKLPDSLYACCEPLFVVLAKTNDMAMTVQNVTLADRSALESVFKHTQAIEERIKLARPDERLLQALSAKEKHLQLQVFHVFKIVALLHVYQAVLHSNSATLRMRYMNLRLIEVLPDLLGTNLEGMLTFPLFIAGICSSEKTQRSKVMNMFDSMQSRMHFIHLDQVRKLVEQVWRLDEMGNKYVNWNQLVESQGLNLSFC